MNERAETLLRVFDSIRDTRECLAIVKHSMPGESPCRLWLITMLSNRLVVQADTRDKLLAECHAEAIDMNAHKPNVRRIRIEDGGYLEIR